MFVEMSNIFLPSRHFPSDKIGNAIDLYCEFAHRASCATIKKIGLSGVFYPLI